MPKIISQTITPELPGLWFEGHAYSKSNLYKIDGEKLPPVNYDSHTINSHSLTHIETSKHTQENGKTIDQELEHPEKFFGKCLVLKLKGNHYKKINDSIFHWEVSLTQLQEAIDKRSFSKLLLSTEFYPENEFGFHDPNYVLTLSKEASQFLSETDGFNLYGTSWKSSDYNPGELDRPIHNILFQKAVILECLNLKDIQPGEYFLHAFPLPIKDASESPVMATLFTYDELR